MPPKRLHTLLHKRIKTVLQTIQVYGRERAVGCCAKSIHDKFLTLSAASATQMLGKFLMGAIKALGSIKI